MFTCCHTFRSCLTKELAEFTRLHSQDSCGLAELEPKQKVGTVSAFNFKFDAIVNSLKKLKYKIRIS